MRAWRRLPGRRQQRRRTQSRHRLVDLPPSRGLSSVEKLNPYSHRPAARSTPSQCADIRADPSLPVKGAGSNPATCGIDGMVAFQPATSQ